nr:protein PIN-LIKES 3-like [Ipomoea batatas]
MAFLDLFMVALMPVLKTLIITAIGLVLAFDRVDILGASSRHHLNNLVFYVFTPALVASSLGETITASSIVKLWFMPVNILLTFAIGSALGWILVKITRAPRELHGLVISCCAAGNLGNLLLIIIPEVCEEKNSPFGDSTTCSTNGKAYASLSMAIGAVYIWTYIYNIIRAYGTPRRDSSTDILGSGFLDSCREVLLSSHSLKYDEDEEAQVVLEEEEKPSAMKRLRQNVKTWADRINLKMMFAPSTIATIVGIVIGVVSFLRKLIIVDNAPLHVIDSSADMLGDAAIPAMTLIIGANLLRGLKKSAVGVWVVIGVQVVRFVVLPLCGIGVIAVARRFGWVGSDSLYHFVLLLQYALPSAMNIGTITQLFEVGESECSVIMLWNYSVASFALTLWTAYYMWILS